MCDICTTSGKAHCRTALTTETSIRDRGTNRPITMQYFATLVFGLFFSSFRSDPASPVSRSRLGIDLGLPALPTATVSAFGTFEGATIALACLVVSPRRQYGTAAQQLDTVAASVLRRRLDFLESIVALLHIAKSRLTGTRENTDGDTLTIMDSQFERLITGLDSLLVAEIRDEWKQNFKDFGVGRLFLEDGINFKAEEEEAIAESVEAARIELNVHIEDLRKEDEKGRARRAMLQVPSKELTGNLNPDREIEVVTEDDIYN